MSQLSFDLERVAEEAELLAQVVAISEREGQRPTDEQLKELDNIIWAAKNLLHSAQDLRQRNPNPTDLD